MSFPLPSPVEIVSISPKRGVTPMLGSMIVARGSIDVCAGRAAVWAALHDPDRIGACVPGCRRVTRRPGCHDGTDTIETYAVEAAVRLGPVRVPFDGTVAVRDCEAPAHLILAGRGRGGLAGAASGKAAIRLEERRNGCRLTWHVEARIDGPMARLGDTVLSSLAAALSEGFARRFVRALERRPSPRQSPRWLPKSSSRPTMSRSS